MKRFFLPVVTWLGLLVGLALSHLLLTATVGGRSWSGWEIAYLLPGWVGLFLPYAAFAGGSATHSALHPQSLAGRALLLSVISYGLLAYGSPVADYRARTFRGADMVAELPLGPLTPSTLLRLRSIAEADSAASHSFRVGRPFERPPNWLTYLLHSRAAVALFAILAALLGQRTGFLTSGLSPPARRNACWALGLATGMAFFVAEAVGGDWVRANPSNSGVVGAWLPLLVPVVELAFLHAVTRVCGIGCTVSPSQASND
jgi:hypothetical protein